MNASSLYRIGGIAAIVSAVLYILALALSIAGLPGMVAPPYIVSSALSIITIGILTMALLPRNRILPILAFLLVGGATVWLMLHDLTDLNASWWPVTMTYGVGLLFYGWLQYTGDARTLGILALAAGAMSVILGIAMLANMSLTVFGLLDLALAIPLAIWMILLGWGWLRSKGTT